MDGGFRLPELYFLKVGARRDPMDMWGDYGGYRKNRAFFGDLVMVSWSGPASTLNPLNPILQALDLKQSLSFQIADDEDAEQLADGDELEAQGLEGPVVAYKGMWVVVKIMVPFWVP